MFGDALLNTPNLNFEDPKYYGFGRGVITTPDFTPQELQALRTFEWDRINFSDPIKRKKTADMMRLTSDQLEDVRKNTRDALMLNNTSHYSQNE